MKKMLTSALVLLSSLGLSVSALALEPSIDAGVVAQGRQLQGEDAQDRILSKIHTTNQIEITQANLAVQKAQVTSLKNFAQMILNDHTLADQQLAPLAAKLQFPIRDFVPKTQIEIRDAQMDQQMLQNLSQLNGADFDKAYIDAQVMCHMKTLKWLKDKRALVDDIEAKDYVDMQIVTVQGHLKIAKDLQMRLKRMPQS